MKKRRRKRNHAKKQEKEGEEKAKEQNADGDYADNSVSWRFVCVCNPRFTKDCIAEGKRESSGTF
jgi:predicted RNA polymerase sigma factor